MEDRAIAPLSSAPESSQLNRALAVDAVDNGTRRYFDARRARVDAFVDAHFSLRGTLALHRSAVGWDVLKAPVNLFLAGPQLAMQLGSRAAARLGAPRAAVALGRSILPRTAVAREIEWLIHTELLELPIEQKGRASQADALALAILAEPGVTEAVQAALLDIGRNGDDPGFRERLRHALSEYATTRGAAAEITTGLLTLGAGALTLHKLAPGAATLGPALAGLMAQQTAIGAFPLGGWAGAAWYGFFPVVPTLGLVAATTGGLMLASASFAAFAGVISDPVQRKLGLHRRRLLRMIDALERQLHDPTAPGFVVHDHYVARLLDLFDILGAASRLARA